MSCVFFDLDGTLTDPKPGITKCIQYALERLNAPVPHADELTWCIGPPLLESFNVLVGDARAPEAVALYRERFADVGWRENSRYEGIIELLGSLNEQGYTLHIATSKPAVFANRIVDHFELRRYFDNVFGAELDGTRSNKSELLQHALGVVGAPQQASMVGDRKHDIIGALANGLRAVGVSYGYGSQSELRDAGAHEIVSAPEQIAGALG